MSDLCTYELEENIWDRFGESDDRIVPHSADEYGEQFEVLTDSRKKPRRGAMGVTSNTDHLTKYGIGVNNDKSISLTVKDAMLEKNPWSHRTDGASPASYDAGLATDVRNIASENSRMSNHGFNGGHINSVDNEFCPSDPMLGEGSTEADNSLYNYSLNHISETENSLSFFDRHCGDKESNDLFYGWPDIGNFEDVDKMFRSCDSTFGLGSLGNEDDLCWFSSAQPTEESDAALTSDSKLSKIPENNEVSRPKNEAPLTDDSGSKSVVIVESRSTDVNDAAIGKSSTTDALDKKSEKKDGLMPNEETNLQKKQIKHLHQSEGKRNRHTENGVSFHHSDNSKQILDTKPQSGNSTRQYYPPSAFQQGEHNVGLDPVSCVQTCMPYGHLNYNQPLDQMSVCPTVSAIKSENNVNPSSSNESSYASNQAQSIESIHGPVVETPVTVDNRGKLRQQDLHSFARNTKNGNKPHMMAFSQSVPGQKKEGLGVVKVVTDTPAATEMDSSNAQETSCVSSVLDDISLEATSFRQLQQVIEQLDVRTKLCIRDSLYRLAKSAEQRHNSMNSNGGIRDERNVDQTLMTGETNKYAGFVDMETDTNPIDRSIAHLLFHRPSESSLISPTDALSYKSQAMVPRSNASSGIKVEKQEETSGAGADNKVKANYDK